MEQQNKLKGIIYTIRSPNTAKYYIGSTIQSMSKRFSRHKSNWKAGKYETESYKIFVAGNAYYELLENFPCNSKSELQKREHELIRENNDDVVNLLGTEYGKRRFRNKENREKREQLSNGMLI